MADNGNISSDCIETINDNDRIMTQLRELYELRSPVYFDLGVEKPLSYISRFQGIHESGALLVDSLMPPGGDDLLRETDRVRACCTLKGARYEFETSLVGLITDTPPALMVERPSRLVRILTRQYARVSFPEESALLAKIIRSAHAAESASGLVVQLGAGGMGLVVESPRGWETGTNIEKIMFALPDGHTIYTAATVRSLYPRCHADGSISGYRCNLQFMKLEQKHSSTLEAFVFRKRLEMNSGA